jgi:hypothetical protein
LGIFFESVAPFEEALRNAADSAHDYTQAAAAEQILVNLKGRQN